MARYNSSVGVFSTVPQIGTLFKNLIMKNFSLKEVEEKNTMNTSLSNSYCSPSSPFLCVSHVLPFENKLQTS